MLNLNGHLRKLCECLIQMLQPNQQSQRIIPPSDELTTDSARDVLLRSATRLFAERAFEQVTVKEIARCAGLNASLINYYFGSKAELYQACVSKFGQERLAVVESMLRLAQSEAEFQLRLKLWLEQMIEAHMKNREITAIIHRDLHPRNPLMMKVFRETFLKGFETLVNYLRHAQDHAWVRKSVDPQMAASLLFGALVNLMRHEEIGCECYGVSLSDRETLQKNVESLSSLFFVGILEKKPSCVGS